MHYNWVGAAGPSVDAQILPVVQQDLKRAKALQSWKPSLEKRYEKKLQDQRNADLLRRAKPGVITELPGHILRYKEYRLKNCSGGVSLTEQFEMQHLRKHHDSKMRTMK